MASIIFILLLAIIGSVFYRRVFGVPAKLTAGYLGVCTICNCMYEIPYQEVCIIRTGRQPVCLACPKCQSRQ